MSDEPMERGATAKEPGPLQSRLGGQKSPSPVALEVLDLKCWVGILYLSFCAYTFKK